MKKLALVAVVFALGASRMLGAAGASVRGTYVEARTAEVFTGGCVMNGEAGTTGREAILAWKVDRGSVNGVPLDGLAVVAAVVADANLGIREIGGEVAKTRTAVFVDARATARQRAALVEMAKRLSPGVVDAVVEVTPSAIQFVDDGQAVRVNAKDLRLAVQKQLSHDPTCGGKQWFHPLASVAKADMGTTDENAFLGASLGTKWSDPNKRSGFFGTFTY
jgi:uncharacterized protein DUF1326